MMSVTMKAFRLGQHGQMPQIRDVPVPAPGAGEVLIRMGGAGLCRTDLELIDAESDLLPSGGPVTLGHENAGWIAVLGSGVEGFSIGDAVVVSAIRFCARCPNCRAGRENYCERLTGRGIVEDGGLAEFMVADASHLVGLGGLQPRSAAPLADAGLSSFHAVALALRDVPDAGSVAVIGVGGLGSFAVQFLRERGRCRTIAVDTDPGRLEAAGLLGAHELIQTGTDLGEQLLDNTGRSGVDAVIDFVGSDPTLAAAARATRVGGAIVVCGRGGGTLPFNIGTVNPGVVVVKSRGGTMAELADVVALAQAGRITMETEEFSLSRTAEAYEQLRSGKISGRAVVTFDTASE